MRRPGWFERRLLVALIVFSLVPSLLLVGIGTAVLGEAVSLQTTPAGWERLGESGRVLLERAEASGDPELVAAAEQHRAELTGSIQQAQRWGYLNRRLLRALPWIALAFVAGLTLLAVRSARRIAHDLSAPIDELVGWARAIGRGEPLPARGAERRLNAGEFAVLRESFRTMAREIELSRVRELEAERNRASIGLARGVAHELKNALTPLRFAVGALQRQVGGRPETKEAVDVIDAESERLETLARAFSQLGRPPDGPAAEVDLLELFEYLLRTHLPANVESRLDAADDLPAVRGHYEALSRAFANLLLNAAEALGEGGGLVEVTLEPVAEDRVEVRISDSGPGLPGDAEERIWDPDYSTKSRGTGLGLALVRQTVQAHGGQVTASTRPGGGAEFRILLPVHEASPAGIVGA